MIKYNYQIKRKNIYYNTIIILNYQKLKMFIDDYQFRHYSAIRGKDIRRFIITNEDQIQRTYLVNISQFQENGEIALCKILLYLSNKGLPIDERIFYLSKYDVFLHPASLCKVPFNALNQKEINLRSVLKQKMQSLKEQLKNQQSTNNETQCQLNFDTKQYYGFQLQGNCCCSCVNNKLNEKQDLQLRNLLTQTIDQEYQQEIQQLEYIPKQEVPKVEVKEKRWKEPQRKIGEVLYAVKKWRKLYEAKKMKLVESAKFIGISKKSLDDYFLVLRIGQIHGFNYAQNLQGKMGDLRSFIRSKGQKVGGKLPKQLKSFDLLPEINLNQYMDMQGSQQVDSVLSLNINNNEMQLQNVRQ